ncbi:hypothetical protein OH76DRAFT_1488747 [Lentinus brumalis]|uniref:Uncharacterized protein n=1 Tax=Lentinus brumalis TaxID=2498619 RepID=A0A371CPT9_9APHY|nr:hypothetical protein OH76DRAFT_1488747 [Polyporus brumalis]
MGGWARRGQDGVDFTEHSGRFNGDHPEDFEPLSGKYFGYFKCVVCDDVRPIHRHQVRKHEATKRHQRRRKGRLAQETEPAQASADSSSGHLESNTQDIQIDWARITGSLRLEPTTEEAVLERITAALREYILSSEDVGRESDDEAEEVEEAGDEREDDGPEGGDTASTRSREEGRDLPGEQPGSSEHPVRTRSVDDTDGPWFPWSDRQ